MRRRLDGADQRAEAPASPVLELRRRLDGADQRAEAPALPALERK